MSITIQYGLLEGTYFAFVFYNSQIYYEISCCRQARIQVSLNSPYIWDWSQTVPGNIARLDFPDSLVVKDGHVPKI